MMTNRKFERTARRRRRLALWLAIMIHLAALAAVTFSNETAAHFPEIVKSWFQKSAPGANQPANVP
jgi:hypothetical protein